MVDPVVVGLAAVDDVVAMVVDGATVVVLGVVVAEGTVVLVVPPLGAPGLMTMPASVTLVDREKSVPPTGESGAGVNGIDPAGGGAGAGDEARGPTVNGNGEVNV